MKFIVTYHFSRESHHITAVEADTAEAALAIAAENLKSDTFIVREDQDGQDSPVLIRSAAVTHVTVSASRGGSSNAPIAGFRRYGPTGA